jgi:hypothetical protein
MSSTIDVCDVELWARSNGLMLFSHYFTTPRFLQFDVKGRCPTCKSDKVEIDYIIDQSGVTISCGRMKQEKFVPFDINPMFNDHSSVRIKTKSRVFELPIYQHLRQCFDPYEELPLFYEHKNSGNSNITTVENNTMNNNIGSSSSSIRSNVDHILQQQEQMSEYMFLPPPPPPPPAPQTMTPFVEQQQQQMEQTTEEPKNNNNNTINKNIGSNATDELKRDKYHHHHHGKEEGEQEEEEEEEEEEEMEKVETANGTNATEEPMNTENTKYNQNETVYNNDNNNDDDEDDNGSVANDSHIKSINL